MAPTFLTLFRHADLSDANLRGANVTNAVLIGSHYNDDTGLPEGLDPKVARMIPSRRLGELANPAPSKSP